MTIGCSEVDAGRFQRLGAAMTIGRLGAIFLCSGGQPHFLLNPSLCLEIVPEVDWICRNDGIGSIDVVVRFNIGHGTKKKLAHKETCNW
jgi:hypothetical protein